MALTRFAKRAAEKRAHKQVVDDQISSILAGAAEVTIAEVFIPGYEGQTRDCVENTAEFRRIQDLPTYNWLEEDLSDLQQKIDSGIGHGTMHVRPIQAVVLSALAEYDGVFGAIGVGEGKTLISYLAPFVTTGKRPLLLVPAHLVDKTHREFEGYRQHWDHIPIRVESYQKLGRTSGAKILDDLQPDLIIADEAHYLRNRSAAVTRRVARYLAESRPSFLAMSGTMSKRSIMDYHHILMHTHGPDRMPLPILRKEALTWARAVDEGVETRAMPGPLAMLTSEKPTLDAIREAVGRRIFHTPGVLATTKKAFDATLVMSTWNPDVPDECLELIEKMEKTKLAPNGDELLPQDMARHVRTVVCGFYYVWDPAPPDGWRDARKIWRRYVRDILELEDERWDSELQIANAVDRGELPNGRAHLEAWRGVREVYDERKHTKSVWLNDSVMHQAIEKAGDGCIIWVDSVASGQRLSKISGRPYFRQQGRAGRLFIDDAEGTIVASIASNASGRNLQKWDRNLVISPPANGLQWEQLLGRTCREGQQADEVFCDVMLGHSRIAAQLDQAYQDAHYLETMQGQEQLLLKADRT